MITVNPGNVYSFRAHKRFQRHRLAGTDYLPFGLPVPQSRIMAWQVFLKLEELPEFNWSLVNCADESIVLTQSSDLLEVKEKSGDGYGYWVTWKADQNLTNIPDCGFWYVKLAWNDQELWGEALHTKPDASFDTVGLILVPDSCDFDEGSGLEIQVVEDDDLVAPPVSQTVEAYLNDDWQEIGPTGGTIMLAEFPPNEIKVRRIVQTASGQTITAGFIISWSDAGGPCDDIHIAPDPDSPATTTGGALPERWRLRMKHNTDKGDVLYQTGYEQTLYIRPVFDAPGIKRENEAKVNGNGKETSRFTRTVERLLIEAPDLPDYVIFFLVTAQDLSQVILEDATSGVGFPLTNPEFTFRRQGPSLNIGQWACDRNVEVFSGCQPNYALVE